MNSREFCDLAAERLAYDMLDAGIISDERLSDVEGCVRAALQAAAKHALLNMKESIAAAMQSESLMSDCMTEASLLDFIRTGNHPDA